MAKRIIAVWALLLVLLSSAFADDFLLMRSLQTSSYEQLVRMSDAYGLDSSLEESELRQNLFDYFEIADEPSEIPVLESFTTNSITIENSDSLFSGEQSVILSGNVRISFHVGSEDGVRTLEAQKVVVDIPSKRIEASGFVHLDSETENERTFEGQAIVLDWSNLDIVIFDGASSQTRSDSSGGEVLFFASGDRISYSGTTSAILFRNGTISTTLDDPYWSIAAQKIAFSDSDLFIDNAIFRLGRVPIFYFPIFFYPGTTLSFNPSMGFSSEKGAFLNTTTEVYGKYPGLGKSSSDDEMDVSDSIVSLLSYGTEGETIRDGLYYRPIEEGEQLGDLESWARTTSSYMAIMADVYESKGLVLGIDTQNNLASNRVRVSALGAIGYRAVSPSADLNRLRYGMDFSFSYRNNGLSLSADLPFASDPYVKQDYLNRNTAFGLDSVLGREQHFPSTYTSKDTYTRSVSASYSKKIGNYSFNLSSLKANIDYKLERQETDGVYRYESTVVKASLPYVSFSTSGKILDLKSESKTITDATGYTNVLAREFEEERLSLEAEEASSAPVGELSFMAGPDLKLTQTSVSQGAGIRIGYTYYQTFDNLYVAQMVHDRLYTKINGTVYVNADAPGSWLSISETLKPSFSFSDNSIGKPEANRTDDLSLESSFVAKVPKLGIGYVLNQKVYHYNAKQTSLGIDSSTHWGEWTKSDVTAHNLTITEHFGLFNAGLYMQFKPLTEIIRPSAGFTLNGFTLSANFAFERKDSNFEKGDGNIGLSYSNQILKTSVSGKYDFKKLESSSDAWDGLSVKQSFEFKAFDSLIFSESASLERKFEFKTLKASVSYVMDTGPIDLNSLISISFKDEMLKRDSFVVNLKAKSDQFRFWKGRVSASIQTDLSFNYDFSNPYKSALTASLVLRFGIAEFIDINLAVASANKSFSRYFTDGTFVFGDLMTDLLKSFDFFGNGRRSTGFNLSSYKLSVVHYMRDWNLYIDAEGKLTTQYSGKYEWVPQMTVCVKWNVLPELKIESDWNSYDREWR